MERGFPARTTILRFCLRDFQKLNSSSCGVGILPALSLGRARMPIPQENFEDFFICKSLISRSPLLPTPYSLLPISTDCTDNDEMLMQRNAKIGSSSVFNLLCQNYAIP